jgi:hypothetical protein
MALVIIDGVIANDAFATPATPNTFVLQDGLEHSQFATGASATSQPVDAVLGLSTWASIGGAVSHVTNGNLVGQSSTISGSGIRYRVFNTTGALIGQSSLVIGSSARAAGIITHSTSGALTGQPSSIIASATRYRTFATSGALTGQLGTIVGISSRFRAFTTSGALVGQLSAIVGSATHYRAFIADGALTGQLGSINGTAVRSGAIITHATSGSLTGQLGAINGAATRFKTFETSGDLTATASIISGVVMGTLHDIISNSAGGGIFQPRKPKILTKPRPAWMPPILWALPLDENDNPLIESTTVGDAELYIRKRLMRRRKDEAELLLLRQF